jgi:processive rubber oxygenase RoxA-like protein
MNQYERLAKWYKRVTWFGILVNLLFVFPLVFAPRTILNLLALDVQPVLWARSAGILVFIMCVFYFPASLNLKRYRLYAWLAIFPARFLGAVFFILAVFVVGYPQGYLSIGFVDLGILSLQLLILLNIRRVERGEAPFRKFASMSAIGAVLVAMLGSLVWYNSFRERPQRLADESIEEYFKYGSIGAENQSGLPYWIWLVLPRMFPDHLPGPGGYASFGLPWEQGREMPIGFTKKTIGFDRVAFNCAFCHTAVVRRSADDPVPIIYPGGPSHTLNALAYERFLFKAASDPRFTTKNIMNAIAEVTQLSILDKALYRFVLIPFTRKALLKQKEALAWTDGRPDWGPGRIDPFNPVKVAILQKVNPKVGVGDTIGNADMVAIWNLRARGGMAYHWDGLNTDVTEVVLSSAIGDGATPKSIPLGNLHRLQNWLMNLKPAPFPFLDKFDASLATRGAVIFKQQCASCHAFGGEKTGKVLPASEAGTDPHRAQMWTPDAAQAYHDYSKPYPWAFTQFRSTGGYVNLPLDAVWIRAPYLHNGSVPSLVDLLSPPAERPKVFFRGYDVYDPEKVGFVSSGLEAERYGFRYDTSRPGNGNGGHLWGTDLGAQDKKALIEYLKTL